MSDYSIAADSVTAGNWNLIGAPTWENARNVDPGAANVVAGVSYYIHGSHITNASYPTTAVTQTADRGLVYAAKADILATRTITIGGVGVTGTLAGGGGGGGGVGPGCGKMGISI